MKRHLRLCAFLMLLSGQAAAQTVVETSPPANAVTATPDATIITAPGETVTTTVQSPGSTTTTKVVTNQPHSFTGKLKNGNTIEIDSDGSVYQVYSDGARVTAEDGIHTLLDGTSVAVKDGKRIP